MTDEGRKALSRANLSFKALPTGSTILNADGLPKSSDKPKAALRDL